MSEMFDNLVFPEGSEPSREYVEIQPEISKIAKNSGEKLKECFALDELTKISQELGFY